MKRPIDKEYLKNTIISFESEVLHEKYVKKNDIDLHAHENKNTLDKIGETDTGKLLFDGKEIKDGANGKSAFEIAVNNGFTGTEAEWIASLKGEKGEPGKDGIDGTSTTTEYDILTTSEEVKENTTSGKLVDSLVIKEVFQSVSNGKELIASAITDKGVQSDADDTFAQMAEKISMINNDNIMIPLEQPTNVTVVNDNESVVIKWTDPNDIVFKDIVLAKWAGTIVVRKEGSAPTSQSDGTVVVNSKSKNQYSTNGFIDSGLENGTTYYYGIFPYTLNNIYNYTCVKNILHENTSYELAPDNAYNNWDYTLDDTNNTITLNRYTGAETDVIVYANYVVNNKIYKTCIASNIGDIYMVVSPYMFSEAENCSRIKSIIFNKGIDTSNTTNMRDMFAGCYSLINLDVNNLNTSNVTYMGGMFNNCGIASLSLSNFNTNNVTGMEYMFENCDKLINIDLSNFDTTQVTNMNSMFMNCSSLVTLDLSNFDTNQVTDMNSMFMNDTTLKTIYVSSDKWSISQVIHGTTTFKNCGTSSVTYK